MAQVYLNNSIAECHFSRLNFFESLFLIIQCKINPFVHVIFLEFWVANRCDSLPKDVVSAEELEMFLFSLNGNLVLKHFFVVCYS